MNSRLFCLSPFSHQYCEIPDHGSLTENQRLGSCGVLERDGEGSEVGGAKGRDSPKGETVPTGPDAAKCRGG